MSAIPESVLLEIERHFHAVIRGRAGDLVDEHQVELPRLLELVESGESKSWLAVPGMCGGFSYWLEGEGAGAKLITESWCRVVDGSGQRHEITAAGSTLVEKGFV